MGDLNTRNAEKKKCEFRVESHGWEIWNQGSAVIYQNQQLLKECD